jgi:alkyl hydroperoxide reductase subunit F
MESEIIYDLAIIGGGPAGVAAGVYAARKKIKTIFLTESFHSQSTVSDNIQNWIGNVSISGPKLAEDLEKHLRAYADNIVEIKTGSRVKSLEKISDDLFLIKTVHGEYKSKTVLIASGSSRKKLEVKGAEEFENRGITYCATCDGPLFSDMDVAVIGGGNSAFESALQLAEYTKSVTILQRSNFRADPITINKALENPKIKAIPNTEILEIKGDKFVSAIVYKEKESGKIIELPIKGVFVEIGANPSVDYIMKGLVELNERDQIIIDHKTHRTSQKGIWAAGDCTDSLYRQNNIAVGDAIKALENIFYYLKAK